MNYIVLDFQKAFEYWDQRLCPFIRGAESEDFLFDDDEATMWFDKWIVWLADSPLIDGTDIQYLFVDNERTRSHFDAVDLTCYRIVNEYGDDVKPLPRSGGKMADYTEVADG